MKLIKIQAVYYTRDEIDIIFEDNKRKMEIEKEIQDALHGK